MKATACDSDTFTYDSLNRLTSAKGHTYTYTGEGVRLSNVTATTDIKYVYDTNAELSRMLQKTENGVVAKYVYGHGLIGEAEGTTFRTYHFDLRGSTVAITDMTGSKTDTFTYDMYGKMTARTGTTPIIFGYNGRDGVVTDANGLLYMRARYYSPDLRRFINADILAGSMDNSVTLNRYAYANGNPAMNVDPLGLMVTRDGGISYVPKTPYERKMWVEEQKIQMAEYKQLMQRISESNEEPATSYMPDWWNTAAKVVVGVAVIATATLVVAGIGGSLVTVCLSMAVSAAVGGYFNERAGGNFASGAIGGAISGGIQGALSLTGPLGTILGGTTGSFLGTYITQGIDNCFAPDNMKKTQKEMWLTAGKTARVAFVMSLMTGLAQYISEESIGTEILLEGGWSKTSSNVFTALLGASDEVAGYLFWEGVDKNNRG